MVLIKKIINYWPSVPDWRDSTLSDVSIYMWSNAFVNSQMILDNKPHVCCLEKFHNRQEHWPYQCSHSEEQARKVRISCMEFWTSGKDMWKQSSRTTCEVWKDGLCSCWQMNTRLHAWMKLSQILLVQQEEDFFKCLPWLHMRHEYAWEQTCFDAMASHGVSKPMLLSAGKIIATFFWAIIQRSVMHGFPHELLHNHCWILLTLL